MDVVTTMYGHTSQVRSLTCDSSHIVSGGWDHSVRTWDWYGRARLAWAAHDKCVSGIHIAPHFMVDRVQSPFVSH